MSHPCISIYVGSHLIPISRELSAKKHEAQALMSEMEGTTQAFEDAQEQNLRLVQELKVTFLLFVILVPRHHCRKRVIQTSN